MLLSDDVGGSLVFFSKFSFYRRFLADMLQQRMTQWQQLMSMHLNMLQLGSSQQPKSSAMENPSAGHAVSSANHLTVPSYTPNHKPKSSKSQHRASLEMTQNVAQSRSPITTITIEDDDMPLDLSMGTKRRSENGSVAKSENTLDLDENELK